MSLSPEVLVLSAADAEAALSMEEAISAQRDAFGQLAAGHGNGNLAISGVYLDVLADLPEEFLRRLLAPTIE